MHAVGGVDKSEWIQKLAPPEQRLVHFTQGRLFTDGRPFLLHGLDLMVDDLDGVWLAQQKHRRSRNAKPDLTGPLCATDEHGLRSLQTGSRLRANVVGGRQGQLVPVPECRMVAGMVIGVAAQDVEDDSSEQLPQGGLRVDEAVANDLGQFFVTGVRCHHFIEFEHRQCRHHSTSAPMAVRPHPVKAFNQLTDVVNRLDPDGTLEFVVIDTDGAQEFYEHPDFKGKLHGAGETAWIKDGVIQCTSGLGYNPNCFEPNTKELLAAT